jgi:cytochrome c peroxidase
MRVDHKAVNDAPTSTPRVAHWICSGIAGLMLAHAAAASAATADPYLRPQAIPAPADNQFTAERIELGKALFFDPRMSKFNDVSCASCHQPNLGWSDGRPTAIGNDQVTLPRATPTIINIAYNPVYNWDGKFGALEDHAMGLLQNERVMSPPVAEMVAKLEKIPGYVYRFHKAYPGEGITHRSVAKALANFQRTVVSTESPFDRWRKGDHKAVDASVKRGFELFTGKGNCSVCHEGFNFTDNGFHNIGVKDTRIEPDLGRYAQRKLAALKGAFKTPTLRDVALTAPYMRNGIYKTLEEVVDHYDRGGDVKDNLSPNMKPLHLTAQEKNDLKLTPAQIPNLETTR